MFDMRIASRLFSVCLGVTLSVNLALAAPNPGNEPQHPRPHAGAQSDRTAKPAKAGDKAGTIPDAKSPPVRTKHRAVIAGKPLDYIAEAGMLPLLNEDGTYRASIFFVAYTRQDEKDKDHRPVTFCFNGGPGSSSVWLHLGGLGPRRVKLSAPGAAQPAPFGLTDNEFSILPVTDLVFIDPVSTGYSRPAGDNKPQKFFGETPDIESVGEFVRLWTTRQGRWLSPKFVCGESYGVLRAAGLSHYLHSRYGMSLSGLVLISGAVDFSTLSEDVGRQVFLPAYTAVAHYHHKLPPDLQADLPKALAESRAFMRKEYAAALFQGASLPAAERARVAAKLARLTGLPAKFIEDHNLRIGSETFGKELLRDRGLIVGRFDGRITGNDSDPASSRPDFDPSFTAVDGAFSAAMNAYVRGELKFVDDLPYGILNGVGPWSFGSEGRHSRSVAQQFAAEMNESPHLRVLVLNGRCDLACPVDMIRYNFDHLHLNPTARANITFSEYAAGHMMYVNPPDLKKMQKTLEEFIQAQ